MGSSGSDVSVSGVVVVSGENPVPEDEEDVLPLPDVAL